MTRGAAQSAEAAGSGTGSPATTDAWQDVRADGAIQFEPVDIPEQEPPDLSWLERIFEWLANLFKPIGEGLGLTWPVFKWVLIALAVAGLLWLLWRLVGPQFERCAGLGHGATPSTMCCDSLFRIQTRGIEVVTPSSGPSSGICTRHHRLSKPMAAEPGGLHPATAQEVATHGQLQVGVVPVRGGARVRRLIGSGRLRIAPAMHRGMGHGGRLRGGPQGIEQGQQQGVPDLVGRRFQVGLAPRGRGLRHPALDALQVIAEALGVEARDAVGTVEVGQPWRNEQAGLKDAMLVKGVKLTVSGHKHSDPKKKVFKAERLVIDGKTYDLYPDRN